MDYTIRRNTHEFTVTVEGRDDAVLGHRVYVDGKRLSVIASEQSLHAALSCLLAAIDNGDTNLPDSVFDA